MAKRNEIPNGSWLLAEDLLEQCDPGFVEELRRIHDADRLRGYAKSIFSDRRPQARKFLLAYFDYPLNAYRHEGFVKALFKLAEAAGDDQLMGRMMITLDRSVRRTLVKRSRFDWSSRESWTEESLEIPANTDLPRSDREFYFRDPNSATRWAAPTKEQQDALRLFSVATRNYLRRRAWRYFRILGKAQPDRYISAISEAISRYTDEDVVDGVALLDNWSLMHVMFHDSDQITSNPRGWRMADDGSLGKLKAAPAFEDHWKRSEDSLLHVLGHARSRPVRQWAFEMLRSHHPNAIGKVSLNQLLEWLSSGNTDLVQIASDALDASDELANVPVETWLKMIDESELEACEIICGLLHKKLDTSTITLEQAVRLAEARPVPVARLGRKCLEGKTPQTIDQCQLVLSLAEAQADSIRPELVTWVRNTLNESPHFQSTWIVDLLDSRFDDVRDTGWEWLINNDSARNDSDLWQQLLETPYDDVRLRIVDLLERNDNERREFSIKKGPLNPKLLRSLWATVLLNVHRGGRQKPRVVSEIVELLSNQPEHADELMPLLAVALRSVRSVEWRSGLAGVVTLVDQHPELTEVVEQTFPELALC